MKKMFVLLCSALISVGAFAQKGEKAVGVNLNFGTTASSVGLEAKFQYGITDAIRIEPSLTYYFGNTGMLDVAVNAHYLFNIVPKINLYPLAGLGFDACRYEVLVGNSYDSWDIDKKTDAAFKFDFGGGAEYEITDNIAAGLELRYEIISGGFSQFVVGLGATYKFYLSFASSAC